GAADFNAARVAACAGASEGPRALSVRRATVPRVPAAKVERLIIGVWSFPFLELSICSASHLGRHMLRISYVAAFTLSLNYCPAMAPLLRMCKTLLSACALARGWTTAREAGPRARLPRPI